MITTHQLSPISAARLENLVQHALRELRHARRIGDTAQASRCERRMNAMLDQLAKRSSVTGISSAREPVRDRA